MRIRRAGPDDFLAVAALDRVAWQDNRAGEFIPDGEHVWRIWCERALVYCAEEEGDVVGAVLAFPCAEGPWCLHKAFVHRRVRGRGVGSRLFEALLADLDRRGVEAFLTVDPGNAAAIALYEKWGFTEREFVAGFYRDHEDRYVLTRRQATR